MGGTTKSSMARLCFGIIIGIICHGAHANPPPSSPASYHCSAYTCPINFELRPNAATISCVDPDCDELCEWSCTYTGPNVCCVAATTTIAPSTNAPSTIAPSTNTPTTPSAPPPSAQPTPCVSCDLVPCGYCQEGCPPTACKYDPELDEIRGGANRPSSEADRITLSVIGAPQSTQL